MGTLYLIFLIVAVPVFFFMLTWAIVTACRLLFPEQPLPPERDPVVIRKHAASEGVSVPVGVREIREDQRHQRQTVPPTPYIYAYGSSDGFPDSWQEDLWRRRN